MTMSQNERDRLAMLNEYIRELKAEIRELRDERRGLQARYDGSQRALEKVLGEHTEAQEKIVRLERFVLAITPNLLDSMEEKRATSAGNVSALRKLRKRALEETS